LPAEETSTRSQPSRFNSRAKTTESATVWPPRSSSQSVAEMRTNIGFFSGQAARAAANTSSGKRMRFSIEPP